MDTTGLGEFAWELHPQLHQLKESRYHFTPRRWGTDTLPALQPSSGSHFVSFGQTKYLHGQNTGYVEVIPYIPSLQTLRITVRLQSHIESSIHRYITDHAHCAIRKLWAFYVDTPVVDKLPHSNLGFFSIQYWQWENPSAHAKQNGTARVAHIKRVVFDSMRQGRPLVVKDRYNGKVSKTYYGNVVIEKEDQQTFFVPEEQHASGQPFITPDHSQEASGNMF
jgi:hypothetical protein